MIGIRVFASDTQLATEIYLTIAKAVTQKEFPSIFVQNGNALLPLESEAFSQVKQCRDADFIIVRDYERLPEPCQKKLLFATRYKTFLKHPEIIGAFFWQKGRPNIIFGRERLEKRQLKLDASFDRYIE